MSLPEPPIASATLGRKRPEAPMGSPDPPPTSRRRRPSAKPPMGSREPPTGPVPWAMNRGPLLPRSLFDRSLGQVAKATMTLASQLSRGPLAITLSASSGAPQVRRGLARGFGAGAGLFVFNRCRIFGAVLMLYLG